MGDKLRILFLCTGNACRSQMAEGWAKKLKGDRIEAFSAGVAPAGVNQNVKEVMAEAGVDISGQYSKHVDELAGIDFDYVVTLCDNANEHCPVFPGKTKMIHRSFYDPSFDSGTREQVLETFRRTREQIKGFVESFPEALESRGSSGLSGDKL